MRKIIVVFFLFMCFNGHSQTHIEYISEKTDSMALISKKDIDVINNVFEERKRLESLHNLNEQLISTLELENKVQSSILEDQKIIINNKDLIISELEIRNQNSVEYYSKELKKEKNKKISFQSLTGVGVVAIILLLLL